MQNEGDLIAPALFNDLAPALFNDFDGKEESVEELFLGDDSIAVLEVLMESKSKAELISPEDLAWVDSCIVAEPELSMESWDSLKEALLDSITSFAYSYEENNAAGPDEAGNGDRMVVDEEEDLRNPEIVHDQGDAAHVPTLGNRTEENDRDDDDGEKEIQKEIESSESIFRVWDLQEEQEEKEHELIPELTRAVADLQVVEEEEDQLLSELKQAVAQSILRDKQRDAIDEATTAEDAKLDELISTMGDLSLKPSSK